MKTKTDGHARSSACEDGCLQRQGIRIESRNHLQLVRIWKNGEKVGALPIKSSQYRIPLDFDNFPGKLAPGNAMHREAVIVKMQKRRGGIEHDLAPASVITETIETVCPRIEEWDADRASLRLGNFQIINSAKQLSAAMTKRSTQHA